MFCTAWHHKASLNRIPQGNEKKECEDLALTEKHLGNIHEGLEGDDKVAHVGASKEVGFKLWQVSEDFVNLGSLVVS